MSSRCRKPYITIPLYVPENLFDQLVERTPSPNRSVGQPDGHYLTPVVVNDTNFINANISIFPGNMHFAVRYRWYKLCRHLAQADATYEHKNILKGGETRVKLNGLMSSSPHPTVPARSTRAITNMGGSVLSIPQLLLPW